MILGFNVRAGEISGSGDGYKSTLFPLLSVFNSPPLLFSPHVSKNNQKV